MPSITINLDDDVFSIIKKRAKSNLLSTKEQVEDIVRRSAVSYKNKDTRKAIKPDDKLVSIFSRHKTGRKPKKRKKKMIS
jgi:hypothetical protein